MGNIFVRDSQVPFLWNAVFLFIWRKGQLWREGAEYYYSSQLCFNNTPALHHSRFYRSLPPEYLFSRNQSRHAYIMLLGFPWGVCARACERVTVCACVWKLSVEPDYFYTAGPDSKCTVSPVTPPRPRACSSGRGRQRDTRQHDLGHWQYDNLCSRSAGSPSAAPWWTHRAHTALREVASWSELQQ